MLTLPQTVLATAAHFTPTKGDKRPVDNLRAIFIRRNGDNVEVSATDGHVAVRVTFPHTEPHNVPEGEIIALPIGTYASKPLADGAVTITPADPGYVVRTAAPKRATMEESLRDTFPLPDWLDRSTIFPEDRESLLSSYARWSFNPALMGRLVKAAGTNTITTLCTNAYRPCYFAWSLPSGDLMPDGAEVLAVLMPKQVRHAAKDPHAAYTITPAKSE